MRSQSTVMKYLTASLLLLTWVAGCAPASREELTKEVLKRDPDFAAVLEKHRELSNRVETYQRELALKRATIEQSVAQLRKELAAAAAGARTKTAAVKQQMEPDRQRLELALSMASEELRAKRVQRSGLGRSIARLRKALSGEGTAWSADERARQETQIQEMLHDAKRLDQEMAALTAHLRLLKIKLVLIKL